MIRQLRVGSMDAGQRRFSREMTRGAGSSILFALSIERGRMDRPFLRAAYDREAATYDAHFLALQWPKFDAFIGSAGAHIAGLEKVLDVGCGTGLLARYLVERATPPPTLVGIDFSREMLRQGRGRPTLPVQADMEALPFRDGTFDAVVSITAFRVIPADERLILAEMARVLRPGGALILSLLRQKDDANLVHLLGAAGFDVQARLEAGQDVGYRARRR